jgi:hypothetical protein
MQEKIERVERANRMLNERLGRLAAAPGLIRRP